MEEGLDLNATLLLPLGQEEPIPVMICLQGHTAGAHVSLGEIRHPKDKDGKAGDRDFARQVIARGMAAFVMDQRCFGEREDARPKALRSPTSKKDPFSDERCRHQSMLALLLGRTMVGERVHDVMQAITVLDSMPEIDSHSIYCMGNSGGGTITYYAACLDSRIAGAIVSCGFSTYEHSICRHDHCCDNYLPGALKFFDMPDLAVCIAPRPLVVVSGLHDPLFPPEGVRPAVSVVRDMYTSKGHQERFHHVEGSEGHRFYAKKAWPVFLKQLKQ